MARHVQLELDLQLCFPLYAASRALTRAYAPLLEPHGLTYPQYLTLLALWSGPPSDETAGQSVGDLGARLRLDSGTLTPLLKRLEQAGLVRRRRDHDDERRVIVTLTPKGDELQDEVAHVPAALVERVGLAAEDLFALRILLDRMLTSLDQPTAAVAAGGTR
jgi:DNA-binding MarR family transcriptional regulator